jgi:hypothetical protein
MTINEIATLIISIGALLVSYISYRKTVKADLQAAIVSLEVRRQDLLILATKINLAQITRNVKIDQLKRIIETLPANIGATFAVTISKMEDLTVPKDLLDPMEVAKFTGSHSEKVQIEKNIGVLTKTKEMSDRYDALIVDIEDDLKKYGLA